MAFFSRSFETKHYSATWSGSAWGAATQYNTGPDESIWMVAANCPKRNEVAIATLDYNDDVRLYFKTGSGFSSHTVCTTNAGGHAARRFDVAYEKNSGDMLLVYWNTATSSLGYRTYSGSSVSAQSTYSLSSTDIRFVALTPSPINDSIGMLAVNSTGDLYAALWTGAGWFGMGAIGGPVSATDKECFALATESLSGEALVVYGTSGSSQPKFKTYVAGVLSAESSMASVAGTPQWIRMVSDPLSNKILCIIQTSTNQLMAYTWGGSSWTGTTPVAASTGGNTDRRFDVAFEPSGTKALLAYSSGASTLRYKTFDGANWSGEQNGPNFGNVVRIVKLMTGATGSEILGLCTDDDWQLNAFAWSGSAITGGTLINDPLGGEANCEAFALSAVGGAKKRIVAWKENAP